VVKKNKKKKKTFRSASRKVQVGRKTKYCKNVLRRRGWPPTTEIEQWTRDKKKTRDKNVDENN